MPGDNSSFNGVGVAFSGGGFRSFSEVAAIEDMERNNVPIAATAGTSMGSIVAALVAGGLPSDRIEQLLVDLDDRVVEQGIASNLRIKAINMLVEKGIIPSATIEREARTTLEQAGLKTFGDLKMPLAICACDVISGRLVVFTQNQGLFDDRDGGWECIVGDDLDLAKCISASASYPLVIEPTTYLGRTFIDGGARMNLPTAVFDRDALDGVVGVGMAREMSPLEDLNPRSIALRTMQCGANQLEVVSRQVADVYINLPVSGDNAFLAGTGRQVIREGRDIIAANPVDYAPIRPSALTDARRILADSVSKMLHQATVVATQATQAAEQVAAQAAAKSPKETGDDA